MTKPAILGLLIFFLFALLLHSCFEAATEVSHATEASHSAGQATSGWAYSLSTDALTDRSVPLGCLTSDNTVDFPSPYGASAAKLCFRRTNGKLESYFAVDDGQILCPYDGCPIKFRIGEKHIQTRYAGPEGTYQHTTVFFTNAPSILRLVNGAGQVRIAADFYQDGTQTFLFSSNKIDESKLK